MRTEYVPNSSLAKAGMGVLLAAATAAAMLLPASARAGQLIVPHATEPHDVTVHAPAAASPTPAPTPGPAPSPAPTPAPAPSYFGSPGGAPSQSSTAAPSFDTVPEDERPGAEVPPGPRDPRYPANEPDYGDGACRGNCLHHWHDWYFWRIQTVKDKDPDAADLLREELKTIDAAIRAEGGRPGAGSTDGPEDEPSSPGLTLAAGTGYQPADGSQFGASDVPTGTSDVPTGSVEVIFGPVELDLEPVDLGTWDLSGVGTFVDMMGGWMVRGLYEAVNGSTICPRDSGGDEVPICQN